MKFKNKLFLEWSYIKQKWSLKRSLNGLNYRLRIRPNGLKFMLRTSSDYKKKKIVVTRLGPLDHGLMARISPLSPARMQLLLSPLTAKMNDACF